MLRLEHEAGVVRLGLDAADGILGARQVQVLFGLFGLYLIVNKAG
jgi:hypothetical protein